jgi:DNA polymerase-1
VISPGADRWQRFTTLINTPVQGGCADGLKRAMVDLGRALPSGARMVSTVHDELLIECDEDCAAKVAGVVRETMTTAMQKLFPSVPIAVEVTVGQSWAL